MNLLLSRPALALGAAAWLAGCGAAQHDGTIDLPVDVPAEWSADVDADTLEAPPDAFWDRIGDPELTALIDLAFDDSPGLQAASARLDQAEAVARQTRAGLFPTVNLDARASRQRTLLQLPGPNGQTQTTSLTTSQFSLQLTAAWAPDLWGGTRATRDATMRDLLAGVADAEVLALDTAEAIAVAWVDARYQRVQRALIRDQLATNGTWLDIVEGRFANGTATALDILQQQQQLEALQRQIPLLDAAENSAARRIDVLTGRVPGATDLAEVDALPELPLPEPLAVPASWLEHRPDVRAARLRAEAADRRVAAAIANRLPSITLTGSIGLQSPNLGDLFDDFVWSAAAGLTQPLFDAGRLRAEQDRTEAVVDERVAQYAQTLLAAMQEVEDALANEAAQRAVLENIDREISTAERAFDAAVDQYRQGVIDYLRVLTPRQTLERLALERVQAERQLVLIRLGLLRAMGAPWTDAATELALTEESPQ